MYESLKFKIKGVMPTIMHNGQTSDPLNEYAKKMKKITGKRSKTDSDHKEVARLEWYAALYVDEHDRPCWPGENIESMLVAAAKKSRMGPTVKSGLFIDGNSVVEHDGPRTADALWNFKPFGKNPYISRVPVSVNKARVMRTRPIFNNWSLEFVVNYMPSLLAEESVVEFVNVAGKVIGLSDWRPKYGRFQIESYKKLEVDNG
jgi:hypothetical protein